MAHRAALELARETPVLTARSLSERLGGTIALKAENLQRTGSFKLRGALTKLDCARSRCGRGGVVAGSAGNHGQSLAYAARARGVPCLVHMPASASVSKCAAVRAFGGEVVLAGAAVDDCVKSARAVAEERGMTFVHPFDDPAIVAGQAGVGLEVVEQMPELATVVVPIGGGGLVSGVALAVKQALPGTRVVGVRAERYPATIADGIAVKSPTGLTLELIDEWVDEVVTVPDDVIADAMVLLLERSKLVVEGAGAAALAALLAGRVDPAPSGTTVAILSGGNVDPGVLASIVRRAETGAGRRLRLMTVVPDKPGGLAELLAVVAEAGGDLIDVEHVRDAVELHVGQTGVELTLAVRDETHAVAVQGAIRGAGYEVTGHG